MNTHCAALTATVVMSDNVSIGVGPGSLATEPPLSASRTHRTQVRNRELPRV